MLQLTMREIPILLLFFSYRDFEWEAKTRYEELVISKRKIE